MNQPPFHLAFPVKNLNETREFFETLLGCTVGRTSDKWIDFNFFGHQVTAHLKPEEIVSDQYNQVDGEKVPVRHFGTILEWAEWEKLAEKLKSEKVEFIISPTIRFKGQIGEQATMFINDPSGNALEFKSFKDPSQIFSRQELQ